MTGETHPRASPQRQAEYLGRGPPCPLTWAEAGGGLPQLSAVVLFSSSSSAAAFSVGSCSQHPGSGRPGRPAPTPTPAHSPLPSPRLYAFSSQLTEQEEGNTASTPVRGPGCPRGRAGGEGQSTAV